MKTLLNVALAMLFTGGIVLAPTVDGNDAEAVSQAADAPEVQQASRPDFLNRLGLASIRRSAPTGPSDAEAVEIALARGAELREQRRASAGLSFASGVDRALPVAAPAAAPAQPAQDIPGWRVTGERVNLRAGPGTGHDVVGQVQLGERLLPVGDTNGPWIKVRRGDGQEAWVFGRFLARADG